MDAYKRPKEFSREYFAYAENKKVLEIFENMLEHLMINRPEKPIDFLYDLLMKRSVYDVPRVYVLGPPTIDRKLVCSFVACTLHLVYLTQKGLEQNITAEASSNWSDLIWVDVMKKRIEMPDCAKKGWLLEAFPKTRSQAFALRKAGVFPTHIVVITDPYVSERVTLRTHSDVSDILTEERLQEMVDYLGQIPMILDLHSNSYIKKFEFERYGSIEVPLQKAVDFVRSKQRPPMPYLPRVLLLGPYGSGRKTMARKLTEKFKLIEVNYQEELRKAALRESPMKEEFCEVLKTSAPVPDELLVKVASKRLLKEDCSKQGWVMYNFPDTSQQAKLLAKSLEGFQVNRAIFLDARLITCLQRVEPRRWDPLTGQKYDLKDSTYIPSLIASRLIQLHEDSAESVRAEHELYSKNADDLKSFFRKQLLEDIVTEVDANRAAEEVFEYVQAAVLKSAKMKLS